MVEFITLAVDTSTRAGQVALLDDRTPMAIRSIEAGSAHGRELAPAIADLLETQGVQSDDVDLIAVGLGPGSYTGLRVGAATALGFALGAGCPLSGVSSLAARALCVGAAGETVFVVTDGGNKNCYSAAFRIERDGGLTEVAAPQVGLHDEAAGRLNEGWIVTGEVARSICKSAAPSFEMRLGDESDAVSVGRLGLHAFRSKGPTPPDEFKPLYLRKSSAEINWEKLQKKEDRRRKD